LIYSHDSIEPNQLSLDLSILDIVVDTVANVQPLFPDSPAVGKSNQPIPDSTGCGGDDRILDG
jgi:hypothetical protein